jgi:hypothetical protein
MSMKNVTAILAASAALAGGLPDIPSPQTSTPTNYPSTISIAKRKKRQKANRMKSNSRKANRK